MSESLVRASVEGTILVSAIWLVVRGLPRLSPGAKALLWWCAAAKVIVTVTWGEPIVVPVLPVPPIDITATGSAAVSAIEPPSLDAAVLNATATEAWIPWTTIALSLWALGCGTSLLLAARRWRGTRRAIARSRHVSAAVDVLVEEVAALLSMRAPVVRLSADVATPLVTGLARPTVLLPASRFEHMPLEHQRLALCHEFVHIRRGDTWFGCVPAAAERLFFFHPFVRLAAREFAFWREAACDAAVIRHTGADPRIYGRLLIDLGVSSTRRSLSAAGAAWSFDILKRRIVMLESAKYSSLAMRLATVAVVALALLAIAPLTLGARAAIGSVPPPDVDITVDSRQDHEDLRFVFFANAEQTTISGRRGDVEKAGRHRTGDDPLLWFIRDNREYIVRDVTVLAELQRMWSGLTEVGAEQGEVGSRQAAIGMRQATVGAEQAAIGAEQAAIGAKQATVGARQAAVSVREAKASTEAERAAAARERDALDEDMRVLDREMRKVDEKMRALDSPMRDLDDDMRVLDREMRVLDDKMREAEKKAAAAMRELIDRAIASGTAQRVE